MQPNPPPRLERRCPHKFVSVFHLPTIAVMHLPLCDVGSWRCVSCSSPERRGGMWGCHGQARSAISFYVCPGGLFMYVYMYMGGDWTVSAGCLDVWVPLGCRRAVGFFYSFIHSHSFTYLSIFPSYTYTHTSFHLPSAPPSPCRPAPFFLLFHLVLPVSAPKNNK